MDVLENKPNFYPRPPRGGRLSPSLSDSDHGHYFYPRPPRGGRHPYVRLYETRQEFLSTPSARRATLYNGLYKTEGLFLSTPSARRATGAGSRVQRRFMISIHALREEGDIFSVSSSSVSSYFYPRPPRGGRPVGVMTTLAVICISIHALREEGDMRWTSTPEPAKRFLSTPSARRATAMMGAAYTADRYFYPRPPRGGRPQERLLHSTRKYISIHALREEGDVGGELTGNDLVGFLSTPSARRATCQR